ncbi:MAG: tyrosine-type recombinase/integrase [Clostridia bacterium]|nr:tyrosine-type recombinase/integrase [Clostridia bacterium]
MPITKTDKKKNGLQGYRVRVRYIDANGEYKQIERTAYGKSEAQATEQQLLSKISSGDTTVHMTVRTLYDEYMQDKKHNVRETTYDKVRRQLELIVLPYLADVRLDALNTKKLQTWKDAVGALDTKVSTKQKQFQEFSALLNFAVRRGYLPKNPLSMIGNFKEVYFEKPQDKIQYYTAEQYLEFAAAARASAEERGTVIEWGMYVFFSIAFYTGARKGEINALKWSDIDGNILHIRRSIAQKLKGEDRETPPKNKSSYRDLQIPSPLMNILNEQKQRQQNMPRWSDDWRICGGTSALRDTTIEKKNVAYAAAANLPHIRIHDFRHTHASVLVNEGINIQEIARRLGHSKVEQTWSTYAHLYPREEERAVAIFNRISTK